MIACGELKGTPELYNLMQGFKYVSVLKETIEEVLKCYCVVTFGGQ